MLLKNERETKKFAQNLTQTLTNEAKVLALYGQLGSGKTTFVQGLAEGLGIEKRILSPTFVFQRSYELRNQPFKRFHHLDLYRISTSKDAQAIGIEEILNEKDCLVAIEWPEIIEKLLPKETIRVRFEKKSDSEREITVEKS